MGKIKRPVKGGQGIVEKEHIGTRNLINLRDRTPEDRRRIQAMGGAASGKSRSVVMKLNRLISKGMNEETAIRLSEIMHDSNLSSLDIRLFLEKSKSKLKTVDEQMKMGKLLLDWHKQRHGETLQKQQIEHFGAAAIKVTFEEPGDKRIVDITKKDE